ncbi:MAG: beta-propeller fold lactonase family protein [Solirubrobacterales bacterium]
MKPRCLIALALAFAAIAPAPASASQLYETAFTTPTSVGAYSAPSDGTLTPIVGSPYAVGAFPAQPAMTPDANFLYVSGPGVFEFSHDADGSLTPLPNPITTPNGFFGEAVSPDGRFLFVATKTDASVKVFQIAADGNLSEISGSPFPAGNQTFGVAVTPDGDHLYAANTSGSISAYSVAGNGTLTSVPGSPFATGAGPFNLSVTPNGSRLYVAAHDADKIFGYTIAANGSLSPVTGTSFNTGDQPYSIAIAPDGNHLYTANEGPGNVSAFTINGNGSLSAVAGSPFASGAGARGIALTPDGEHLYVGNRIPATISSFTVSGSGALSAVAGSPFAGTASSSALVTTPDQSPKAAFTADAGSLTVQFDADDATDLEGPIARYDWNFGDGTTLPNGGPNPSHTYASVDTYDVSLIVTDGSGCSVPQVFTGQTAYCSGNPKGALTKPVTIDTKLEGAKLKAKPAQKQKGGKVVVLAKAGAAENVKLVASGKVKAAGKSYALKKLRKSAKSGKLKKLKLKPKGRSSAKRISKALGGRVKATVQVKFTDAEGNTAEKKKSVRLK